MATTAASRPANVLLISHARSTSNLVVRMLFSKQSGTVSGEYCFGLGVIDAREAVYAKPLEDFDDTEKEHSFGVYQASASKLQALSAVAENENKIATIKEHSMFMVDPTLISADVHGGTNPVGLFTANLVGESTPRPKTNPTVLPDALLNAFQPIFVIRHPALAIPSYVRVVGKWDVGVRAEATQKYSKQLYDWFSSRRRPSNSEILLIDSDDVLTNPTILQKVCQATGLDSNEITYSWNVATEEDKKAMLPIALKMEKNLHDSTGIVEGTLGRDINITDEVNKWKTEFGNETAIGMAEMLERELVYYTYLTEKRLRP